MVPFLYSHSYETKLTSLTLIVTGHSLLVIFGLQVIMQLLILNITASWRCLLRGFDGTASGWLISTLCTHFIAGHPSGYKSTDIGPHIGQHPIEAPPFSTLWVSVPFTGYFDKENWRRMKQGAIWIQRSNHWIMKSLTAELLMTHTPRWMAQGMVMRLGYSTNHGKIVKKS